MALINHEIDGFQSTLPTRGSDTKSAADTRRRRISIHAPHEGERPACAHPTPAIGAISIHAPHEGERPRYNSSDGIHHDFNPRSPRGGATINLPAGVYTNGEFQSTLPTRGSDKRPHRGRKEEAEISIHAPHEGERLNSIVQIIHIIQHFNPRSPRGGATLIILYYIFAVLYFNPRSPRGGATTSVLSINTTRIFQSTLPTRGSDPPPRSDTAG